VSPRITIRSAAAAVVAAIGVGLLCSSPAAAHPLGNFTVNRYAGLELAGNAVYVHYAVDLAEIPTFQIGDEVRRPGYPGQLARRLVLRLDGERVRLVPVERRVASRPGAGGLQTLRLDVVYRAAATGSRLEFVDRAFPHRTGWREVTLRARDGARLLESSAPAASVSQALRAYPQELLRSPPDARSARGRFVAGPRDAAAPSLGPQAAPRHIDGGFEALIERGRLSAGIVLLSLLVAAFWGAVHALTPGHGKALVAGYLVGTRGRPRHALLLGATVTVTHTAGVFALGLVTLLLSRFVVPEQLYPWLTLVSGLLVVGVGVAVLRSRIRARHHHDHHDHHHHDHDHHHDAALTSRGLLGVGIAAGLLPCPSALVVLLSAIALQRVGFGLALIVAFSLGLATTITAIGLVAVLARRAFARLRLDGPLVRTLPAVSALVIVLVGLGITVRAVPAVL
jgi:ABC-type nickel/cobalt efflux system permease component RcnA